MIVVDRQEFADVITGNPFPQVMTPSHLRLDRLRQAATVLRRLHQVPAPSALPPAPDDADIIRRYRRAGGTPLPFVVPPTAQ